MARLTRDPLQEFKEFLGYLKSIWGLCTGISILFPFSNLLLKVLPVERETIESLNPTIATALATILSVFVIFFIFSFRNNIMRFYVRYSNAFIAMVLFIISYVFSAIAWHVYEWNIPFFPYEAGTGYITYSTIFAGLTAAFSLPALKDFMSRSGLPVLDIGIEAKVLEEIKHSYLRDTNINLYILSKHPEDNGWQIIVKCGETYEEYVVNYNGDGRIITFKKRF